MRLGRLAFLGSPLSSSAWPAATGCWHSSVPPSPRDAFQLLEGDAERMLPRVPCYFDDLFGWWTDFTGERAAIDEFNDGHDRRKIAKIHGLRYELPPEESQDAWHEKLYVIHVFDHPRYAQSEGRVSERWFEAHRLAAE